jgi:copper transport protein
VRRVAVAVALVALVALAATAAASAHATLKSESPGFQQELRRGPRLVQLRFDQLVQLPAIEVLDARGVNHASVAVADGRNVSARVGKLPAGAYTVRWHVLSSDGHVVSGVWTFGVRVAAPPPTEAYGAEGPTRTEHVVRWLYFVALALTIGALGFRLLVLRGLALPPALEKRLFVLAGIGVVGVLEVGIVAFLLRCEDVLQLPFGKFLYGDLSPISQGTRYGKAFVTMTLGFALVAAFVYLAWLLDRPSLLVPAFVLALAFAGGLSLSGHDAVDPGSSWKSELADWVHLSAVSLWIGGLVALAAAVWPAAPALRREVFARFSRFATVLVALVLAGGTYLAIVRLPALHDLWRARYGQVLLVKLSLVALVLAWGAVHRFVVRPALGGAGEGLLVRVGRSVAGETAVGIAVLLAAAVLVDSKPPPQPAATSSSSRSAYAGAVGSSSWRK